MPFDPTVGFIIGVAFLSLVVILIYSYWYQTFKYKHKSGEAGSEDDSASSVSIKELEAMMRNVIGEATKSLEQRLTALEEEDRRLLAEPRSPVQVADVESRDAESARRTVDSS